MKVNYLKANEMGGREIGRIEREIKVKAHIEVKA